MLGSDLNLRERIYPMKFEIIKDKEKLERKRQYLAKKYRDRLESFGKDVRYEMPALIPPFPQLASWLEKKFILVNSGALRIMWRQIMDTSIRLFPPPSITSLPSAQLPTNCTQWL